jgi:phosphatidylinositol dimannoside acyltransferase
MNPRHVLSWKSWYYKVVLPGLRRLGPEACDSALALFGRAVAASPGRRREIAEAVHRANAQLGAHWDEPITRQAVASNLARYSARDYPLDGLSKDEVLARFDVRGAEHLDSALSRGRGVVLVSSHLGAHVSAHHWLDRQGIPTRLLVQRPNHVSRDLHRRFDRVEIHPQSSFFLRRSMTPAESVERLLRARSALRDGLAVYLSGDILWPGPNCRKGRLLGVDRTFLAIWADLAAHARAPVVFLFAKHRPGGRYALTFDAPRTIQPGLEDQAVTSYLRRLEAEIVDHPADAVAYLLWPCFGAPAPSIAEACPRIGRRVSVAIGAGSG